MVRMIDLSVDVVTSTSNRSRKKQRSDSIVVGIMNGDSKCCCLDGSRNRLSLIRLTFHLDCQDQYIVCIG